MDIIIGKSYYIIYYSKVRRSIQINIYRENVRKPFDEGFYYFKKTKKFTNTTIHLNEAEIFNGFFKDSKIHENCKEFISFKEFMKDYKRIKRLLLIKEVIE
jgi:hypothetical protein